MVAVERVLERVDVRVVGKATTAASALTLLVSHHPDVFIADPKAVEDELDAVTLLRLARERAPRTATVVLSASDDLSSIDAALEGGAHSYVLKRARDEDLASAIRQTFDRSVFAAAGRTTQAPASAVPSSMRRPRNLTRREVETLRIVAEGCTNAEIARLLTVAEETVKYHLSNIYQKLDVANRTEASHWAGKHGLLTNATPRRSARLLRGAPGAGAR